MSFMYSLKKYVFIEEQLLRYIIIDGNHKMIQAFECLLWAC